MGIRISSCSTSSASSSSAVVMASVAAAAVLLLSRTAYTSRQWTISSSSSFPFLSQISMCEEKKEDESTQETRTCRTPADKYYSKHQKIPLPSTIHATIPSSTTTTNNNNKNKKNILVIGDVHGCLDELQQLHTKAKQQYNNNQPFRYVILVGDLCNKGPCPAAVIQYVRAMMEQNGTSGGSKSDWYAVRGNHDDAALAAMLGDEDKRRKKKYHWIRRMGDKKKKDNRQIPQKRDDGNDFIKIHDDEKNHHAVLSDEDVMWLSELPYTITIPRAVLTQDCNLSNDKEKEEEADSIVVHAGLVPGIPLEQQTIEDMITLREVVPESSQSTTSYKAHKRVKKKHVDQTDGDIIQNKEKEEGIAVPWAKAWKGPQRVIFGHDAKRGLQLHRMAIGLDTGACYGKRLSGLILPGKQVVSVDSKRFYSPIS